MLNVRATGRRPFIMGLPELAPPKRTPLRFSVFILVDFISFSFLACQHFSF
jgi:hypothetical protein